MTPRCAYPLSPLFVMSKTCLRHDGERVRVRGRSLLRRLLLPLTPTLSPQAGRGRSAGMLICLAVALTSVRTTSASEPAPTFTADERAAILSHGPWPAQTTPDPGNRVSGMSAAIALGRQLFFDTRLSRDGSRSCATCHDPAKSFADGRPRSLGHERLDRNAIALANLRLNRWYGWSGGADSLWAQSCARSSTPRNSP